MKRFLFVIVALSTWAVTIAQQSIHIVQRGETFDLIARRYNISTKALLEANSNVDQCFVGMKLTIPEGVKKNNHLTILTSQDILQIEKASGYLKSGKYKKAVSTYTKVIQYNPSAASYFGRGVSYYNQEKYKSAIRDFEITILRPDCSTELKGKCEELISTAKKLRGEQHARRNKMWGEIAAVVVGAAAITASAAMANNSNNYAYLPPSKMNGFQRDTSLDYLLDPRLAIMQAQQQEIEEYETFKKLSGYNGSLEEYRMLKAMSNNPESGQYDYNNEKENNEDLSSSNYQEQYKRWEHQAEGWYRNLTTGGVRYEDKNGNKKGITTGDMAHVAGAYSGNQMGLKNAQKEMRRIRQEAAKHGVHIAESKWETATSGF